MIKTIPYITKKQLVKANAIAIKRGYNRALREDFVAALSDGLLFPVIYYFVHSHKQGEPCEPHIRVVLAVDGDGSKVVIDCDWNLFYQLDTAMLTTS